MKPTYTSVDDNHLQKPELNVFPQNLSRFDLIDCSPIEIKKIGQADNKTIEALLVGYLVADRETDTDKDKKNRDKILSSGIKGTYFSDKKIGVWFELLLAEFKENREALDIKEIAEYCRAKGMSADQATYSESYIVEFHSTALIKKIRVDIVIKRFLNAYRASTADSIYLEFIKNRENPDVGLEKAIEIYRGHCTQKLADPSKSKISEYDIAANHQDTMDFILDMKKNPKKYKGINTTLNAIDSRTNGMHPGTLTLFVAGNGGYKTTTMLNVALLLWRAGYDVLYVTLEMVNKMMDLKLKCAATRKVPLKRLLSGKATEDKDWEDLERLQKEVNSPDLAEDKKLDILEQINSLRESIGTSDRTESDINLLNSFYENEMKSKKNQLKFIYCEGGGFRPSDLETYLKEKEFEFKPQVVIVDYLALMKSDNAYPDRRDLELDEITKSLRTLGATYNFAAMSASQLKSSAKERMRKYAGDPEKVNFGTNDLAESAHPGNNADSVFVLWANDGGNKLLVITIKARYGQENRKGEEVQLDADTCSIGNDIEDTKVRASNIDMASVMNSAKKLASGEAEEIKGIDDIFEDDYDMNTPISSPNVDTGDEIEDTDDPLSIINLDAPTAPVKQKEESFPF